jgi:hypothetical protein
MPDYLGNIQVPEIAPSGVFPILSDYPHGRAGHVCWGVDHRCAASAVR